jgi:GntR family transcriptional regulator
VFFVSEVSRHFTIDLNSPLPRYYQIQQNILDLIDSNVLRAGDALPSERGLSEAFGVSRMTVRQAISKLSTQGVLRRLHGVGTFVTEASAIMPLSPAVTGFSERIRSAGMTPASQVITLEVIPATPVVAERLVIEPNSPVIFLKRLRLVNDEPLMVEKSYLSHQKYSQLLDHDFSRQSLYDVLGKQYQIHILETEETLEPTLLNPEESRYFGLKAGQPAMLVQITAYTDNHQPVEFCKSVIRGDQCRYFFRVNTPSPMMLR